MVMLMLMQQLCVSDYSTPVLRCGTVHPHKIHNQWAVTYRAVARGVEGSFFPLKINLPNRTITIWFQQAVDAATGAEKHKQPAGAKNRQNNAGAN